ncbi:DUF3310 domain-containing protein [Mammaliicoccus sp. D-M17]|uniref:DUF3310 domain-containing protein n=1 Tax=Mammaliicoccus sp. D-M17 TaxID=2898677 RepID=UPI001EFBDB6B|nr:DUF3310 domain-containing protein [Mammaliicoccus sp. D-M17]
MKFKTGDRVHVTRINASNVDFFTTLQYANLPGLYQMIDSTDSNYNGSFLWKSNQRDFGPDKKCYYTLATDENKGLRWSDGSSAEGAPVMCDKEDSEEPIIQRTTDTHDPVNKPIHYMLGDIEVKDIIAIVADKYHKGSVAHNVASALEYQMRAPGKNGLEDIKKARKCLDFAIENWE